MSIILVKYNAELRNITNHTILHNEAVLDKYYCVTWHRNHKPRGWTCWAETA